MTKLNDLQSILLASAAARDNGSLYPVADSAANAGARLTKAIAALIKAGLADERETSDNAATCRTDGDLRYGTFITEAGSAAIGVGEQEKGAPPLAVSPEPTTPRVSKSGAVLALLQRDDGATLAELIAATGWLPHTTRAALTGLRKKGHAVERTKRDGATCYRVAAAG